MKVRVAVIAVLAALVFGCSGGGQETPEYEVAWQDRLGPDLVSVGVITEPTKDKEVLTAIAKDAAGEDDAYVFFAESEAALDNRNVFGGAEVRGDKVTIDIS